MPVTLAVEPLPAAELGETFITSWDEQGRPTSATIILSPDAAGWGWYLDSKPLGTSAFAQPIGTSVDAVLPGAAAYGHFDLVTVLLHEIGHVEGFIPANPAFEGYVQTIGTSQEFVARESPAPLIDADQEFDPSIYPGDLMDATLAAGVRELPSPLDVQILDVVNGLTSPPSPPPTTPEKASYSSTQTAPPAVENSTIASTTIVDHAVAALGNTTPAGGSPLPLGQHGQRCSGDPSQGASRDRQIEAQRGGLRA